MINDDLKPLIEENKLLLESLDKRIKKIENRFTWNTIFGLVKFLAIFAPLIIGVIYFTPILKDYVKIFEPAYKTWMSQIKFIPGNENIGSQSQNEAILQSFCDPESRELMVKQFCK